MSNKYNYIFWVLISLIQGCATTFYPDATKNSDVNFPSKNVNLPSGQFFVSNKDLTFEYSIFKQSGLFTESDKSDDAITVQLYPIERSFICGNPLIGSMLFLGTIPVYLSNDATYSFSTSNKVKTEKFYFTLHSYSRFSIWEWFFKPFNSEAEAYAKALQLAKPSLTRY